MSSRDDRLRAIHSLYQSVSTHPLAWRIELRFDHEVINIQLDKGSKTMYSDYHNHLLNNTQVFCIFPMKNAQDFMNVFESLPGEWKRFKVKAYSRDFSPQTIDKIREILKIITLAWKDYVKFILNARYDVMVDDGLWYYFADELNQSHYL